MIRCPHCKRLIRAAQPVHARNLAVKAVLSAAQNFTTIAHLAFVYQNNIDHPISTRSARRAIERLAEAGYLRRSSVGRYITRKK